MNQLIPIALAYIGGILVAYPLSKHDFIYHIYDGEKDKYTIGDKWNHVVPLCFLSWLMVVIMLLQLLFRCGINDDRPAKW